MEGKGGCRRKVCSSGVKGGDGSGVIQFEFVYDVRINFDLFRWCLHRAVVSLDFDRVRSSGTVGKGLNRVRRIFPRSLLDNTTSNSNSQLSLIEVKGIEGKE